MFTLPFYVCSTLFCGTMTYSMIDKIALFSRFDKTWLRRQCKKLKTVIFGPNGIYPLKLITSRVQFDIIFVWWLEMRMPKDEIKSAGLIDEHCKWKHGELHQLQEFLFFASTYAICIALPSSNAVLDLISNPPKTRWRCAFRKIDSLHSVYLM